MTTSLIDDGWQSDHERAHFFGVLSDPRIRHLQARSAEAVHGHHVTHGREIYKLAEELREFDTVCTNAGIGHVLSSLYPVDETTFSSVGLHRRLGKPEFSDRDRSIVHVVLNQVDWLHRQGTDVRAKHAVLKLSSRERQVMVFLLGGDSLKEVSRKLELSEHTVGDYVKEIYRHFSVNSRAELLAHFIAGGQC